MDKPRYIDVLSDSTGETAEKVVRAALLQFPQAGAQIRLHTRVRTKEVARPVLERAAREGALLVFTVVSPELREFVHGVTAELKIEAIDVIGSLIGKLGTFLDREPINLPSAMLPPSEEYFRRIEAVEFAVKSDDGKEPRNFKKADLVLVGVSRTSKTPLSTLLAQRGLKVAISPSSSASTRLPSSTRPRRTGSSRSRSVSSSSARSARPACASSGCRSRPTTPCASTSAKSSSSVNRCSASTPSGRWWT